MRSTGVLRATTAALLALVVLAGCTTTGDPPPSVDGAGLATDLAGRLARSGGLTFTAVYVLPGSTVTVSQAQHPGRAAYAYAQGELLLTPSLAADCRISSPSSHPSGFVATPQTLSGSGVVCTLTPPPSSAPETDPVSALLAQTKSGLIAPSTVEGLLTAAAVGKHATVTQHDTTIAGENATCVDVSGVSNAAASQFTTCITAGGLLASFQGTVDSTEVDVSLDRYDSQVAGDAFEVPIGATVHDKRPGS
jgi:hypothetical protein